MSDPESSSSPSAPIAPGAPVPGAPGGPPPNIQKLVASKRLQQAQAQVGEVVDIMRVNVEKVLERDQKISELDRRADDLQEGASQFQQHAVKLKRKYWWENIKMWIIIGVILLAVVIIVVVTTTQAKEQGANGSRAGNVDDHATSTTSAAPAVAAPVNPIPGGGETVPNDIPSGGGVPSPSASIG
eukprot:00874.XXX_144_828_1 [CDS] Oithona nana genome sequencing.